MELYICRLKLDNVEKSFELQREKNWKPFPAKKIANFWGREGEQAVISSNRVWGGMCLWKSNFKISQKTITGAIFVSPIPKSPPQHNPLMYLVVKCSQSPSQLPSSAWAEALWMKWIKALLWGSGEMKGWAGPHLREQRKSCLADIYGTLMPI